MKYFTWQSLPQSRICVWGLSRYQFARDWVGFQGMEFSVLKLRKFCANQSKLATPHLTQWPLNKENQSWLVSSCAQQPAPLGSATFAVAPWGEGGGVVKSQEDACASTRAHAHTHTLTPTTHTVSAPSSSPSQSSRSRRDTLKVNWHAHCARVRHSSLPPHPPQRFQQSPATAPQPPKGIGSHGAILVLLVSCAWSLKEQGARGDCLANVRTVSPHPGHSDTENSSFRLIYLGWLPAQSLETMKHPRLEKKKKGNTVCGGSCWT